MRRTYWMSVEQICTIITALMLASCVRVHAQFGVEQPFFFQKSEATAEQPSPKTIVPGLAYWWVASDITNGWSVTNWYDRLQNYPLTQESASNRPTNSTSGVAFFSSNCLTNVAITPTASYSLSHFVIIKPVIRTRNWEDYLGNKTNSYFYGFQRISPEHWYASWDGVTSQNLDGINIATNKWYLLVVSEPASGSGQNHNTYTNGVGAISVNYGTWPLPNAFSSVGGSAGSTVYLDGYIRELGIITNTVSASTVSNLFWYATNTYTF